MTSVASRPSYQSIQCAPAGWALRHPDRSYHSPWILTSSVVRHFSSSQASISTQLASSSQSHALEGLEFEMLSVMDPTDTDGDAVAEASPLAVTLDCAIRVVDAAAALE